MGEGSQQWSNLFSLFVSNLPIQISLLELRYIFSEVVVNVFLLVYRVSKKPRCYTSVRYKSKDEAVHAVTKFNSLQGDDFSIWVTKEPL